jgi:methylated-DNA-[protein]-cysteine S-methyltransferase
MPSATTPVLYSHLASPIGELLLVGDERHLTGLYMSPQRWAPALAPEWRRAHAPFAAAREQLTAYFDGDLLEFDLPLRLAGTPFRQRVWAALREIPYGQSCSYGELAVRIGQPTAARAVGLANGRNPISIIVPCHRVVGADGSLTGYGGGLDRKQQLLDHEAHTRAQRGRRPPDP